MSKKSQSCVIYVCEAFEYGAQSSTLMLADLSVNHGFKVKVFYGERPGTQNSEIVQQRDFELIKLRGSGILWHIQNIKQLYLAVRVLDRQAGVIIHGQSSYGGMYAKAIGMMLGITAIYSPRGPAFVRRDKKLWQRIVFLCIEKITANMALTVACGPSEKLILKKLGGRVIGIYNGLTIPRFERPQVGHYYLGAGRICYQKGFDVFKEVALRNPDRKFVWAGGVTPGSEHLIKNLPENIKLIGRVSQSEVSVLLQECKAVLHPSRWEGLSRLLLEAISAGRPIITSDFPANRDCLKIGASSENYLNGFSCENLEEYDVALRKLDDEELVKFMQYESYKFATERYDLTKINRNWLRLYVFLLSRTAKVE